MDLNTIAALDRAFDRLLEAADQLRAAERSARGTAEEHLAHEIGVLLRTLEADADALSAVIRSALRA